jgi:hypothetical protein
MWKSCGGAARALESASPCEIRVRQIERWLFLFMDVLRPLPYLAGLLNRMVIKAIAVSPFIRDVKRNREALDRRMCLLWN